MLCRDIAVQHKQSLAGTLAVEESVEPGDGSGCHCVPCEEAQGQRDTDTGTKSRVRANEASELIKAFQISPKVSLFHQVKHTVSGLENIISWASLLNQLVLEGLSSTFRGAQ